MNPVRPGVTGRGTAADVTRLAALWADLDVKPGALPSLDAAEGVIGDLGRMLGTPPAYVVASGHGLHPYWAADDDEHLLLDVGDNRAAATALLARWRRLVDRVARAHGAERLDNVHDLARILRTPGTMNYKDAEPVPVTVEYRGGHPLDVAAVTETLDGYGAVELPGDRDGLGEVRLARADWPAATRTCGYVNAMIDGWRTDTPTARHPWMFSALIRLACARRAGCITDDDARAALDALQGRLDALRAADGRRADEVAQSVPYAVERAERMTDAQLARELGNHTHEGAGGTVPADGAVGADADADAEDLYQRLVNDEVRKLRARRDAQDVLRAEEVTAQPPPPALTGTAFLAQPDHDDHLVDGLIPRQGKFLIAAAAKAGKTTCVHYTIKSLLDGTPMFGKFSVNVARPLQVHILDNEMGDDMLRAWLRRLGLTTSELDRLVVHSLLGYASTFDPTNRASRRQWARRLSGADVVIIDCLSPFMQAVGLDENHDAGRWLAGIDELMAAADVEVYGIAHHTGHDGERARGDSKILGWPFQTWTLNREAADKDDDDADDAPRFIKARGRCGSIPSGQLVLTADGLTYMGGATRAKARAETAAGRVLTEVLAAAGQEVNPGEPFGVGRAAEWVGKDPKTVRPALYKGVGSGLLTKHPNPHGSGAVFSLVTGGRE